MSKPYIRHQLLKNAKARLETFKYTVYEPNSVSFMENGLYFQNNALICFSCGGGSVLESITENLEDVHLQDCQYLKRLDVNIYPRPEAEGEEYIAGKPAQPIDLLYPRIANRQCGDIRSFTPIITAKFKQQTIAGVLRREIEKPLKNALLNVRLFYLIMRKEFNRLETFKVNTYKWPVKYMNERFLVKAGFFYTLIEDIISCYVCRVCIGGLNRSSNVIEIHKQFSPDCPLRSETQVVDDLGVTLEKICNENATLECKICYKRSTCILFNCNHMLCCHVCARNLENCPLCRATILTKQEIVIS